MRPDIDNDGTDDELECTPYDDTDATLLAEDADCDGVADESDCMVDGIHRGDSTVLAEDADCDGVVTEDDCDDEDASLWAEANDTDCDGYLNPVEGALGACIRFLGASTAGGGFCGRRER